MHALDADTSTQTEGSGKAMYTHIGQRNPQNCVCSLLPSIGGDVEQRMQLKTGESQ